MATDAPYCFWHRFDLSPLARLSFDTSELVLSERDAMKVFLRSSPKNMPIKDCDGLILAGRGFSSEDEASAAATSWRGLLARAFAGIRLGVDFRDDAPSGGMTNYLREQLEGKSGRSFVDDTRGPVVFPCDPRPTFVTASPVSAVQLISDNFTRSLEATLDVGPLDQRLSSAYDIYGASCFVAGSPNVRLLLLMMALETIIKQDKRDQIAQKHVDDLVQLTMSAPLDDDTKNSMRGALERLRRESIMQAGRRLAASVGDKRYNDMSAGDFFRKCYEVRSKLIHGEMPSPTTSDVRGLAARLELLVCDLLAGPEVATAMRGRKPDSA